MNIVITDGNKIILKREIDDIDYERIVNCIDPVSFYPVYIDKYDLSVYKRQDDNK